MPRGDGISILIFIFAHGGVFVLEAKQIIKLRKCCLSLVAMEVTSGQRQQITQGRIRQNGKPVDSLENQPKKIQY